MYGLRFIWLGNAFVFPHTDPPIINILYEWWGICGRFGLFFYFFSHNIMKVNHFCIVFFIFLHLISSFLHKTSLVVPLCTYFYWIKWFYYFIIISTKCNLHNFFSKYIIFLPFKSLLKFCLWLWLLYDFL